MRTVVPWRRPISGRRSPGRFGTTPPAMRPRDLAHVGSSGRSGAGLSRDRQRWPRWSSWWSWHGRANTVYVGSVGPQRGPGPVLWADERFLFALVAELPPERLEQLAARF